MKKHTKSDLLSFLFTFLISFILTYTGLIGLVLLIWWLGSA